jgi:hypothetical protein
MEQLGGAEEDYALKFAVSSVIVCGFSHTFHTRAEVSCLATFLRETAHIMKIMWNYFLSWIPEIFGL